MVCFGTARNSDHPTCDCPILRNLGFKVEKRSGSDSAARDAASRVATDAGASAGSAPTPAPAAPVDTQPGSASSPPGPSARRLSQRRTTRGMSSTMRERPMGLCMVSAVNLTPVLSTRPHPAVMLSLNLSPDLPPPPIRLPPPPLISPWWGVPRLLLPLGRIHRGLTQSIFLRRSSPSSRIHPFACSRQHDVFPRRRLRGYRPHASG
jgi:hypothetical protein